MIREKLGMVGDLHVMGDVNISSGESSIRQILAGKICVLPFLHNEKGG